MTGERQAGYALTEVLVAGAIAAMMLIAGLGGLALSVRTAERADAAEQAGLEARNITARLRAGISAEQVADAYPEWAIRLSPYDRPVDPRSGAVLTRGALSHPDLPGGTVEFVFLEAGPGASGDGL